MAAKWKDTETFIDRRTKVKTVKRYPIAGVKTEELVELCTKEATDLRRGESKLRVKARKELTKRGVAL